jgi:hypothetical protein
MDEIMSNINAEMKASADYAIKSAKERFGQELDFSEESIVKLNNILGQIYWGFSNHPKDEGENGLIFNTAIIWGSYLGEYMRIKWGGTWISKGSERLVSIENNQFSPINFVYQKISSRPETSVEDFLFEYKVKSHLSLFNPQPSQHPSEITGQLSQHPPEFISKPKVEDDLFDSKIKKLLSEYHPQTSKHPSEITPQPKVGDDNFESEIKKHLSVFNPQSSQHTSEAISQPLKHSPDVISRATQHPSEIISQPKVGDELFEPKISQPVSEIKPHSFQLQSEIISQHKVTDELFEPKISQPISDSNPQPSLHISGIINRLKKSISVKQSIKTVTIDKRLIYTIAGIAGILLIVLVSLIGYKIINAGGISAFGLIASATSTNANSSIEITYVTATIYPTITQYPTVTMLPTYTPNPTNTPLPSLTPLMTHTQIATLKPTDTQTPLIPTDTQTPTMSPTSIPYYPTDTPIPPTGLPAPTATALPAPTATVPAPIVIESCEIDPSTVPIGINVPITFIVHFSANAPGYGFEAVIEHVYPEQSGCSGISDGNGMAYCNGSSGVITKLDTIAVTIHSSVGDCVALYSSH